MIANSKIVAKSVNPVDYHVVKFERGDTRLEMSSSSLRDFWDSPSKWIRGKETPETKSQRWGNIVDAKICGQFSSRYVVYPEKYKSTSMVCPRCQSEADSKTCRSCKCERVEKEVEKDWNENSLTCQAWVAKQQKLGLIPISEKEDKNSDAACAELKADEILGEFLSDCDFQVLIQAEWRDADSGIVIPIRCLLDFLPRIGSMAGGCVGDLKTCRDASTSRFEYDCEEYGYDIQGAWNFDLVKAALPKEDRNTFCFLLSENSEPFETGRRILSSESLSRGRVHYRQMIAKYCSCLKNRKWPKLDDDFNSENNASGWGIINPPRYSRRKLLDQTPEHAVIVERPEHLTETDQPWEASDDIIP